ncbi:hypothetical protein GCM10008955_37240 [Deinococcus malanensis]|uniref:Histidine kinase n=1 Tax=Deinococcus malanensis TaxID=1706855 RepID=A0ABQ2F4T0_9DEIO|nr:hypothetical protein [Deinococcus malanensis]GGK40019.1 hypothetical protein GCM10008955_37240 [Deinococcus malanensis]
MQSIYGSPSARQTLPLLSRVAALALLGLSLSYNVLFLVFGNGFTPVMLTIPIFAVLALVVASGWKWAPIVAGTLSVVLLLPELPLWRGHFADETGVFLINVVFNPVLFVVAIVTSFGAGLQNLRGSHEEPAWLLGLLTAALGLVLTGTAFGIFLRG